MSGEKDLESAAEVIINESDETIDQLAENTERYDVDNGDLGDDDDPEELDFERENSHNNSGGFGGFDDDAGNYSGDEGNYEDIF